MGETKLNRRDMLKVLGGGVAGAAVAARLGVTSAAPTLVAPAVRSSAANQVTLKLMTWGSADGAQQRDAALRAADPDVADRFKVKVVVGGAGDFDVAKAVRLSLASGQNIPEMVQLNRTQVAEFAAAGELLELDQAYAPVKDDLYAGVLDLVQYNGTFVCFPFELKSKLFYYRTDLFSQAEIAPSTIKSVTDFINAGKALHAKFPTSYILNLGPQPAQYWMGEILSAYPGARFAAPDGTYQVSKLPAFADTFTFLKNVKDSGVALPVDDFTSDWQQAWPKDAIAGSLLANWPKFFLPKFAPQQTGKWKVDLWPALSPLADQRYGSEAGGSVYVVPKRADHAQEAVAYLSKMFLAKQGAMAIFNATGTTPLLKSAKNDFLAAVRAAKRPAGMSAADWAAQPVVFFGPDFYDVELKSYDYVKVLPYDPQATKEVTILGAWLDKYLAGKNDLTGALKGAEGDMKSQIGNPYKA